MERHNQKAINPEEELPAAPAQAATMPLDQEQVDDIIRVLSTDGDFGLGPRLTDTSPGVLLRRGQQLVHGIS
jgi:hypothetical protein